MITQLDCPQCGGANSLPSGRSLLRCAFCDAALFVDRSGLVLHYRLPRLLDRDQATAALKRWMAGNQTVKNLDRKATLASATPIWFPVWMFRLAGDQGEEIRIQPAAPTPISQLADLRIPAGELKPFTAEMQESHAPAENRQPTIPIETARGWLGEAAERVRETARVHLPLWECRYQYEDRGYVALVDGSTGTVMASVFPEKAESPFWLVALTGLILFALAGLVISHPLLKLLTYGALALPLTLLAYWVSRKV